MSTGQESRNETREQPDRLPASGLIRYLRKVRAKAPSFPVLFFIALLVWVLSGFFTVGPDEIGVVKRWGRNVRQVESGLHYHLPFPIETLLAPKIGRVRRVEIGARPVVPEAISDEGDGPDETSGTGAGPAESLMLTRDGSIVELRFIVQYQINKAEDYLFMIDDPEKAVRSAAEAAMREVIGKTGLDEVLTSAREQINKDTAKALQAVLDKYKAGIAVIAVQLQAVRPPKPVRAAFDAVVTAREKREKNVNEAKSFADELLPESQGRAAAIEIQAEAYRQEKVKRAQGEVARFLKLMAEYNKASSVTRQRIYLEAMEDVLSRAGKIVLDPEKGNILPLLNLLNPNPPAGTTPAPKPGPEGDHVE